VAIGRPAETEQGVALAQAPVIAHVAAGFRDPRPPFFLLDKTKTAPVSLGQCRRNRTGQLSLLHGGRAL
jgi:hypothetical protein